MQYQSGQMVGELDAFSYLMEYIVAHNLPIKDMWLEEPNYYYKLFQCGGVMCASILTKIAPELYQIL